MNIGKNIYNLRKDRKILQTQLAQILGVGKTTISNYEHNYSTPDVETLVKIADFFEVSVDHLLGHMNMESTNLGVLVAQEPCTYRLNVNTEDDNIKVFNYYNRLNDENKDLIKGQMIQLFKEQTKSNSTKNVKDIG